MALINMNFSAGGADLVETTLWTNPNTSASFSSQEVTLSDEYTNYDYIKFYYLGYGSSADTEMCYL